MGRLLNIYIYLVDGLSERLGALSQYLVILTVSVGFINVVLRYIGQLLGRKLTSNAVIELQWYLYSLIFFLGFAYILKHNINVRVDFWFGRWSPQRKAWVDLIGHLLALIPFCLIALWVTWGPVLTSWGLRPDGSWGLWEVSPDPDGLPRAPIKSMILVAFATLLLQALAELIKLTRQLRQPDALAQTPETSPDPTPRRIE